MGFSIFEPEETIGTLWDRLITRPTDLPRWPQAAVSFADMQGRLGVFFRTLGGDPGVDLAATTRRTTHARLGIFHRLGHETWQVPRARMDGDTLLLPDVLDVFPEQEANADLYYWLAAWAVAVQGTWPEGADDPLQADVLALRFALASVRRTLSIAPGLKRRYRRLCAAALRVRPHRTLPPAEKAVEEAICALLEQGAGETDEEDIKARAARNPVLAALIDETADLAHLVAPRRYRTFLPVPLWGDAVPRPAREAPFERDETADSGGTEDEDAPERRYRGRRRRADEAEKKDPLILNRFEHILALAEFFNLNRMVDDEDDPESARKARDDLDEISLVESKKKPSTKLRFDLDLSPEDVERERLSAEHVYPEWDYRKNAYLPAHCRVLVRPGEEVEESESGWQPDEATRRRIRAVRRQFEALRPRREILRRQMDGLDFDTDALVRSLTDLAAHGEGSDRIWLQARETARDLSVAVLFDTSRSTESWVKGRQVIDIEKEALTALVEGLAACGDDHAVYAFSSIKRHRVFISVIKAFDEPRSRRVHRRIAALKPGFYTRLGAAIRHVAKELAERPHTRRLLLVITDGKPNDLDHYEGRYGVEDTARAIADARREGLKVFGVTIDHKAQAYFPYIFGRNAYAIVSNPERLPAALPVLYRHLVA